MACQKTAKPSLRTPIVPEKGYIESLMDVFNGLKSDSILRSMDKMFYTSQQSSGVVPMRRCADAPSLLTIQIMGFLTPQSLTS